LPKKHISFGIICNDRRLKKWQLHTIEQLLELKGVECSLIIFNETKEENSVSDRGNFKFKNILWSLYTNIFRIEPSALQKVDFPKWLNDTENIDCKKKNKSAESFRKEDIERIKSHDLDFILNFGRNSISGAILHAAKFGVWSFHHRDIQKYNEGPPCFWEINNKDNATGAVLEKMTDTLNAGIILKKGFIRTDASSNKTLNQLCMESARWPAQLCVDIKYGQTEKFFSELVMHAPASFSKPTNAAFAAFLYHSLVLRIKYLIDVLFYVDYWNIGVAKGSIDTFLNDEKPEVDWFPLDTKKEFIADPFVLADPADNNKLHIFFERYPFSENKGKLDHCMYDGEFKTEMNSILNKEYHLSYPYVLTHEGDVYMVPEMYGNNKISIYKATDFPYAWEKETTLIENFKGIDSTVIKHEGTWWLFTSDNADGPHYNLQLFYSDNLFDGWTPHPKNPVKTDIRSSRCAGTPFEYEGSLIRPGMDYTEKIEGRIVLNKVLKLSKTDFEEESIKTVEPYAASYFSDKIHTLAAAGEYTIVDGCRECFIFSDINFLKSKLRLVKERVFGGRVR
jgi:hypothetical protein